MNSAQRLFLLCAVVGAVLLALVVPFRARTKGQGDGIVYSFVWDPPLPYKPSPGGRTPFCPDGGPSIPALAFEFLALGLLGGGVYRCLARNSRDANLESYPGYQRGF